MSDQNSFFQKPILKILTLLFAFSALTVSILFSQSNSQNKKEKEEKKEELIIYPSSKSMGPTFPKKEKPEPSKETNVNKEQTNSNPAKEIQQRVPCIKSRSAIVTDKSLIFEQFRFS